MISEFQFPVQSDFVSQPIASERFADLSPARDASLAFLTLHKPRTPPLGQEVQRAMSVDRIRRTYLLTRESSRNSPMVISELHSAFHFDMARYR